MTESRPLGPAHPTLSTRIRVALVEAKKAAIPTTHPLAIVDASEIEHHDKWLRYLTDLPSGKTVGVLSVGMAEAWLNSHGITLIDGDGEMSAKEMFTVDVWISGSATIDVEATSEDEAREIVEEMLSDDPHYVDVDTDISVAPRRRRKGSAA